MSGPSVRILFLSGSGQQGIAVARSVGSKPRRNRVRRRIKAALRDIRLPHMDAVWVGLPAALTVTFGVLQQEVNRLAAQAQEVAKAQWQNESACS